MSFKLNKDVPANFSLRDGLGNSVQVYNGMPDAEIEKVKILFPMYFKKLFTTVKPEKKKES